MPNASDKFLRKLQVCEIITRVSTQATNRGTDVSTCEIAFPKEGRARRDIVDNRIGNQKQMQSRQLMVIAARRKIAFARAIGSPAVNDLGEFFLSRAGSAHSGKLHFDRPSFYFNLSWIYVRIIGERTRGNREAEAVAGDGAGWKRNRKQGRGKEGTIYSRRFSALSR